MIAIRPFDYSDADYEARVAILSATNPVPASVAFERRFQETSLIRPGRTHYIVLAESGGPDPRPSATGRYFEAYFEGVPGRYVIDINVLPDFEAAGARRMVYEHLVNHLLPHSPHQLEMLTWADRPEEIAFLEGEGFREVHRQHETDLDTATFDPAVFAPVLERVAADGIAIRTYAELNAADPEFRRKMYELERRLTRDVPWHDDELTMPSFDEWVVQFDDNPDLLENAYVVALDGDEYVGSSVLWASQATDRLLFTALTGVLPAYRRRGIATALKVRAIAAGMQRRDRDGRPPRILTSNEVNNPMYTINVRLGFQPVPDTIVYLKTLRPA